MNASLHGNDLVGLIPAAGRGVRAYPHTATIPKSMLEVDGVPVLQDVPVVQYLFSRKTQTEYQKSVLILITPRQASYTWLSEETKAALRDKRDAFSPSVDVLRSRYVDWFKPYPNLASVFHHFNAADLYREFRTGDVTIDSWERMDTTRQRLKSALEFLYY